VHSSDLACVAINNNTNNTINNNNTADIRIDILGRDDFSHLLNDNDNFTD
jgi:hypothetical protein